MPRIAILPDTLASQVAAGEVVERPASVLKELIENSLDAGATQIDVETRKGGVAQLRVTDNGHGMDKENALLSLERHATSKLTSADGLSAISTHGFRGEALPSIASVSRFKLSTNNDPKGAATEVFIQGGKILSVEQIARAQGTTMEVKDLFFNVPARRKFLKSESTEYAHIEHTIRISALGNPSIRYTFKNNGNLVWDLKPTTDRRTRISDLSGHKVLEDLKEITPYQLGDSSVEGFILPGKLSRGSAKSQTVFINGRPVDDPLLRNAIKDGYHGHIQPGQFPVVWLWINIPPEDIDVNVHPAKREVRFSKPTEIKHALLEAIGSTLSEKPRPSISPPEFLKDQQIHSSSETSAPTPVNPTTETAGTESNYRLSQEWSTPDQQEIPLNQEVSPITGKDLSSENQSPFKIIGLYKEKHLLLEDSTGLVILNPQAAQARITYEQLKESLLKNNLEAQPLLIPLLLELDGHDQAAMENHLPVLNELGVEVMPFGGSTFQIQSLPSLLSITESGDAENFVLGILDTLDKTISKGEKAREKAIEHLLSTMASEASKSFTLHLNMADKFLKALMTCNLPYCTATGKPTMVHYSDSEISKKLS